MGELSCNCSKTLEESRQMRISEIDVDTFGILKDIVGLVTDLKILIGIENTEGGPDNELVLHNLKENVRLNNSLANTIKNDLKKIVEVL